MVWPCSFAWVDTSKHLFHFICGQPLGDGGGVSVAVMELTSKRPFILTLKTAAPEPTDLTSYPLQVPLAVCTTLFLMNVLGGKTGQRQNRRTETQRLIQGKKCGHHAEVKAETRRLWERKHHRSPLPQHTKTSCSYNAESRCTFINLCSLTMKLSIFSGTSHMSLDGDGGFSEAPLKQSGVQG